ncbi:unnamed protein product [Pieris macdunnoughi]|uniref:Glyceraldehyde 3-phosphate dehydrogenase NAD(P) binding domain-containing protein n=1 Tax=Pieris macdunnoughi TaxID=345717 RepID=A0A821WM88_9NEOP|nr:unnamed protein product [Pieris macdunnoughi]
MVIKVGINGFGRIGRVIFRKCLQIPDIIVTAINDPAIDIEYICYLIKFDSTHGKLRGNISFTENEVNIEGTKIKILHEKLPINIPWVSVEVQYVVEASGMFTSLEKASGHLSSGVKRVLVTAPSLDIPMLIVGVNEHMISIEDKVLSCASSTLYCLAPIVKILEDKFGVTEGFVTSIHAMTPSLKPLDSLCLRGRHWRDHRSIHQNIIPAATGACKALHKIIPQIKDKLSGLAFRVPIVNVSVLDMSIRLNKGASIEDIVKYIHQYSHTSMKDIITISNEEAVSSDFFGENHSCIVDVNSSFQLSSNFLKLVCWYENEYSYACRVVDTILFSERQFQHVFIPINIESISEGTKTNRCKSIFIPNNYSFQINPDMISSASQDTGFKMKLFPKTLNNNTLGYRYIPKPQTTLRRVVNKTNEVLKSNKTDDETHSQNEIGPLFQSCQHLGPACVAQSRELRNHEQLEKVKKEFSKVVNMTEDLLKKSSHCNNQINKSSKTIPEMEPVTLDMDEKNSENNHINDAKQAIEPIVEFNNEPETNETLVNITTENKEVYNITTSNTTINMREDSAIIQTSNVIEDTTKNKTSNFGKLLEYVKSEANSLPSISEVGMSENHIPHINLLKSDNNTIKLGQEDIICNIVQVSNNDSTITEGIIKDTIITQIIDVQITEQCEPPQKSDANLGLENKNIDPIGEEIVFPDKIYCENVISENDESVPTNVCKQNKNDKKYVKDQEKPERLIINNVPKNQMVERILHKINRMDVTSAGTSRCVSPCISISNFRPRKKQDIFDKLDSASGSDSETSFEEKKSQVINITDLTNSIEDISRLDKICRIIEISDELSDKLFSALNTDTLNKNKTWSFKDLCERIKLDDFCNKVFGP